jgi:hypothetical protein
MADEKKETTELEKDSEIVKPTGKDSSIDNFLKGGEKPKDMEKALSEEAEKANKAAVKELEFMDKGETPPEKPDTKPKEKEVKKEDAKKEDDEPISEDFRKRYKVPDNIKTMKALADWGPNAEKNMQKALSERDKKTSESLETEKRLVKMEAMLEQFAQNTNDKVKEGQLSEEEKQIQDENMKYLMENKPSEFVNLIREQIRKEALSEEQKKHEEQTKSEREKIVKDANERHTKEMDGLKTKYGETFETDILPAIKKIAEERPYLQSFEEAEIIYLHNKSIAENKAKETEAAKRKEKEESNGETSHRSADDDLAGDDKLAKDIENFSGSLKDLDKLVGLKH